MSWYVIRGFGDFANDIRPPRRAYRTLDEALEALERFKRHAGHHYDTLMRAHSYRILGPFRTRREAERATVADGPVAWTYGG